MQTVQTPTSVDQLAERLRRIVRDRTELDVAQFQFIGLDYIARAYGDRWPQVKARTWDAIEAYVLTRLLPSDILVRGDEGFLIVFSKRIGEAAELAGHEIAFELNTRFVGRGTGPSPRVSVSTQPVPVKELARAIRAVEENEDRTLQEAQAPTPATADWKYLPVWDARREVVSSYFVTPINPETGDRVRGYQFENLAAGERPDFAAFDEASLRISERALRKLRSEHKRALIGVSVHVSTLRREDTATRAMSLLSGFDSGLARYRLIKIAGVEPGFPRMQLAHIVGSLRARVPLVMVSAAWDEPDIGSLIQAGPSAIGFAYPDTVAVALASLAEGTLMSRFRAGADAAHANGMPLYVEGVIGPFLAQDFREAGADYMASPVIWKAQEAPDAVVKWPVSRLPVAA